MVDGKRSLEVQVRTELVTNNNSDSTVFVGVAAKVGFVYQQIRAQLFKINYIVS